MIKMYNVLLPHPNGYLKHDMEHELAAGGFGVAEPSNTSDRDLALQLIRQLRSKGILTEADWSEPT